MHIFSASKKNWNLFVAVDTSFYGDCVHFAFREELQEEAMNMISALPLFLEARLGHQDVWNWFTRRARDESADYEWNLEKGLVLKGEYFADTHLENWEQLDEIDEVMLEQTECLLPFTLDLSTFGDGTYTDDGTMKTSALLDAGQELPLRLRRTDDNGSVIKIDDDTTSEGSSLLRDVTVSDATDTTTHTASTLTGSPLPSIFLE